MVAIDHKSFSKQKNVLLEKNHVGEFIYIDELTFYDVNGTKYYPLQGSNMNIEAVTNNFGEIVENYEVSAFSEVKILAPDGTERASRAVGNSHVFQGRYNGDWGEYLASHAGLKNQIAQRLKNDFGRSTDGDVNMRFHVAIGACYGFDSGYGLLNGSNANVGDFEIIGSASVTGQSKCSGVDKKTITYELDFWFNDIFDANGSAAKAAGSPASLEVIGANLFNKIFNAQYFEVHIGWSSEIRVELEDDRIVRSFGYPF